MTPLRALHRRLRLPQQAQYLRQRRDVAGNVFTQTHEHKAKHEHKVKKDVASNVSTVIDKAESNELLLEKQIGYFQGEFFGVHVAAIR
jgi:hypothetical protein